MEGGAEKHLSPFPIQVERLLWGEMGDGGHLGTLNIRVLEKVGVDLTSLDCVWLVGRNCSLPEQRIGKICLEKTMLTPDC